MKSGYHEKINVCQKNGMVAYQAAILKFANPQKPVATYFLEMARFGAK